MDAVSSVAMHADPQLAADQRFYPRRIPVLS
jgi:hypothetical protein